MAAPQDDIAFRSQEYARQVNQDVEPARQRMQGAVEGFSRSVGAGVQLFQEGMQNRQRNALAQRELMQRQQQIDQQKVMDASTLALQQTRQKQAEYDLWFTQQIHTTKTIQAQREGMEAQAEMAKLGVLKLKREMEPKFPIGKLTPRDLLAARASGFKVGLGPDGIPQVLGELPPEEKAAAQKQLDELEDRESAREFSRRMDIEEMRESAATRRSREEQAQANYRARLLAGSKREQDKIDAKRAEALGKHYEEEGQRYQSRELRERAESQFTMADAVLKGLTKTDPDYAEAKKNRDAALKALMDLNRESPEQQARRQQAEMQVLKDVFSGFVDLLNPGKK